MANPSYVDVQWSVAMTRMVEKGAFRGEYVRMGPFLTAGHITFVQGICLGLAFAHLLEDFLVPFCGTTDPAKTAELVRSWSDDISDDEWAFDSTLHLFMLREMKRDQPERPQGEWLLWLQSVRDRRFRSKELPFVFMMGKQFALQGLAFGVAARLGGHTVRIREDASFAAANSDAVEMFTDFCRESYPDFIATVQARAVLAGQHSPNTGEDPVAPPRGSAEATSKLPREVLVRRQAASGGDATRRRAVPNRRKPYPSQKESADDGFQPVAASHDAVQAPRGSAESLASAVVKAALLAHWALQGKIPGVTRSPKDDWPIRVEFVGFFLHTTDRFLFHAVGWRVRDELLDAVTPMVARQLVDATWSGNRVKPTIDDQTWTDNVVSETIRNFNTANADYGTCIDVFPPTESDVETQFSDDWAVTRLVNNIVPGARSSSVNDFVKNGTLDTALAIHLAAAIGLRDSKLIEAIADAVQGK